MTNKEKAIEISEGTASETDYISTASYNGALEMADWKDEQFKKFLSLLVVKSFDTRGKKKNASETLLNAIFPMAGLDAIEASLEALMDEYETFKEKGTIL